MIFLIMSAANPVKSPTTSGHIFLQQKILGCLIIVTFFLIIVIFFHSTFTDVILPDFHNVLSIVIHFHSIVNLFQRMPRVMNFRGPYGALIYRLY